MNLLTEDNLPYYFRMIERMFGPDERVGRVGPALDRRGGPPLDRDPRLPDRHPGDRPGERSSGPGWPRCPGARRLARRARQDGLVYVALQELATRIAHRNTGKLLGDTAGYDVMARVAADENLHYLFYRDLATAAIERDPSEMVIAVEHEVRTFAMPGSGIVDFDFHAGPSPAPASTTWRATTTRSSCRWCCGTGVSPISLGCRPWPRRPAMP